MLPSYDALLPACPDHLFDTAIAVLHIGNFFQVCHITFATRSVEH